MSVNGSEVSELSVAIQFNVFKQIYSKLITQEK